MTKGIAAQWIAHPTEAVIPTQSRHVERLDSIFSVSSVVRSTVFIIALCSVLRAACCDSISIWAITFETGLPTFLMYANANHLQ